MSIWGKVIGGVAGFALGGPLGGILGAVFGHAVDRQRSRQRSARDPASVQARQTAFTVAVIVLSAKMAKADGHVTRDEINAFKTIFDIPANEMRDVGRLFDEARRDSEGFEPYAKQIGGMFAHDPAVLESLLGGLFQIALADGVVHPKEIEYLHRVSQEFGFDQHTFDRIKATHLTEDEGDPYEVLGVNRGSSDAEIKRAYRRLSRENHPDTLMAQGLPREFVDLANDKMAQINAAYDNIQKARSIT